MGWLVGAVGIELTVLPRSYDFPLHSPPFYACYRDKQNRAIATYDTAKGTPSHARLQTQSFGDPQIGGGVAHLES